jgi:DNA-binding CsgD family transcriptional regulator
MNQQLTPREETVQAMTGLGFTRHDIAKLLGIRPGTVKAHRRAIRRKTASTSTEDSRNHLHKPGFVIL